MKIVTRLLISVRGAREAISAVSGGADIADVEDPKSALGTPYPLNIRAVREALDAQGFSDVPISTNIGEEQRLRSSACQAALGVAVAGADYVKCGLAGIDPKAAAYLGRNLVRTVREWRPKTRIIPAVFPEEELAISFDPLVHGPTLAQQIDSNGMLIDTYIKESGRGLLDFYEYVQLEHFIGSMHAIGKEAWLAGGIAKDDVPRLCEIGADVICIRGSACASSGDDGRLGEVDRDLVADLVRVMSDQEG